MVARREYISILCQSTWLAVFWKWSILGPLPPLPLPRFRFHQNVVILLVAIPPTYLEAADKNNRFRFRFQNTDWKNTTLVFEHWSHPTFFLSPRLFVFKWLLFSKRRYKKRKELQWLLIVDGWWMNMTNKWQRNTPVLICMSNTKQKKPLKTINKTPTKQGKTRKK